MNEITTDELRLRIEALEAVTYLPLRIWWRHRTEDQPFLRLKSGEHRQMVKQAKRFCRRYGIQTGTHPDKLYGKLDTFPIDALNEMLTTGVFDEE